MPHLGVWDHPAVATRSFCRAVVVSELLLGEGFRVVLEGANVADCDEAEGFGGQLQMFGKHPDTGVPVLGWAGSNDGERLDGRLGRGEALKMASDEGVGQGGALVYRGIQRSCVASGVCR